VKRVVSAGREREVEMEVDGARVKRLERGVVVRTPKVNSPISLGMLALGWRRYGGWAYQLR